MPTGGTVHPRSTGVACLVAFAIIKKNAKFQLIKLMIYLFSALAHPTDHRATSRSAISKATSNTDMVGVHRIIR